LVELAGFVGLSEGKAQEVLEKRSFTKDIDADWSRSLKVDPEYIPSLMVNGKLLENPQGYELFERFMQDNRIDRRVSNG
jgi:predicted DsbA family dithiol-disulfide isomerase